MKSKENFDALCELAKRSAYLQSTAALLEWDQQTKMPKNGGAWRAEQLTFLAGEIHRRDTDVRIGDLLCELESSDLAVEPNSDAGATVREMRRQYDKKTKLPTELVEAMARASSVGQQVWIEARKDDDFARFAPCLKEIFGLKREYAEAIGYSDSPYDALLDEYEPGARTADVKRVLSDLKDELVVLLKQIEDSGHRPNVEMLTRKYPIVDQEHFCKLASAKIGFDYDSGRLDVTHHPFCETMGPNDVRLTTRFDERFFNSAFFGTLHEAGHGIYEQGLRADQFGLPPGSYCSLGIHESQSRLWENLVGRSESFWEYFFPRAQEIFPAALNGVSGRDFFAAVNEVRPSLIRVEADEATYNLHIIIRFELEQALLDGELEVDDLAEAWNQKYLSCLGVEPDSDANGVLQDVHWGAGLVGYFPTYTLGNLYASQFFEAAGKELGDLDSMFRAGDFGPLKEWLNVNVHQAGHSMSPPELGRKVTGQELSHQQLMRHLRETLAPIYGL